MIHYKTGGIHAFWNLLRWQGSAFPFAIKIALPCACAAAFLKYTMLHTDWWSTPEVVSNNAVWTGFTMLVGFLVIFRTSQGYARFLEGSSLTHKMRAEWFDSCAGILAFTGYNKRADIADIFRFRSLVIRLFSMLHATALAEIEDTNSAMVSDVQAFNLELIDVESIDTVSLEAIRTSASKPELVYYWINQVVVDAMASGLLTVPPPILSRAFQTTANGMVAFHEAVRLSSIPFPFPYAQACDWLLLFHWVCVPVVTAQWSLGIPTTFSLAFLQVCTLWSLNGIAQELENPFGSDCNDLDSLSLHREMNGFLEMLVEPSSLRVPFLVGATSEDPVERSSGGRFAKNRQSFVDVWGTDGETVVDVAAGVRSEKGTPLQNIGRKSARMIRSLATAVTHLQSGDELSNEPLESEVSSSSEPKFLVVDSVPLSLLSSPAHLRREHSTIGHATSEDGSNTPTGSLIAACNSLIDERHAVPNWHSNSIPSTPPDFEAFVPPT